MTMPMPAAVIARTPRLLIAEHEESDLAAMHTLLADPVAMYYLPDLCCHTLEDTAANLRTAMSEIGRPGRTRLYWKIVSAETGAYVGEIGFTVRLDTPEGQVVNLGYFILPAFWRQGLTSEAAGAVIRYAFTALPVIKIETGCIKENGASERVMRKNGMIQEADYRLRVWHDGRLKDRVEYRLTRDEWRALDAGER